MSAEAKIENPAALSQESSGAESVKSEEEYDEKRSPDEVKAINGAFEDADQDGNGELGLDELHDLMLELGM
eukprot:SAG31_NODE_14152_length_824_cov_1.449655_1_plen_70_part_01